MATWKSPHPRLVDIPTKLTTWQWAFEDETNSPCQQHKLGKVKHIGAYENAVTKERLDFHQVKDMASKLSASLVRECGLSPGVTVSLFSTNTVWYPVAMWATVRAGGRVNGASPAYGTEEMIHALRVADTRILFTLPSALPMVIEAAAAVNLPKSCIILLEGSVPGYRNVHDLVEASATTPVPPPYEIPANTTNERICAYLNFSSGTTGLPKAVMLSHHNIIAQCHQLRQLQVLSPESRTSDGLNTHLPPYRILAVMPLFHITGLVRFCHYPLLMNGLSVMLPSFTMPSMLQTIIAYEIEELILVPPILIRIVRDPVVKPHLPQLQRIVKRWSSGSAPTAPEVIQLLHKMFPKSGFRQGYGATESTACISAHPPSHFDYKYATTGGLLVANTTARVLSLDNPNKYLQPGETGEICAKGPQIAMGYLGNEAATRETFDEEGYFHTGDVGYIDEEGLIHISDRIKEMIKVKGQQVAPAELEDLLLGHEDVEDCAVLGINDEYAGERPKAFVVLKKQDLSEPEMKEIGGRLLQFVKDRKVRYKWITEIEFVDNVPKNPTGKLLRRVLKAREREAGRVKGPFVTEEKRERARL